MFFEFDGSRAITELLKRSISLDYIYDYLSRINKDDIVYFHLRDIKRLNLELKDLEKLCEKYKKYQYLDKWSEPDEDYYHSKRYIIGCEIKRIK